MPRTKNRKVYFILDERSVGEEGDGPGESGGGVDGHREVGVGPTEVNGRAAAAAAAASPAVDGSANGSDARVEGDGGGGRGEDGASPETPNAAAAHTPGDRPAGTEKRSANSSSTKGSGPSKSKYRQTQLVMNEAVPVRAALDMLHRLGARMLRDKFGADRFEISGVVSLADRADPEKYFETCPDIPVGHALMEGDMLVIRPVAREEEETANSPAALPAAAAPEAADGAGGGAQTPGGEAMEAAQMTPGCLSPHAHRKTPHALDYMEGVVLPKREAEGEGGSDADEASSSSRKKKRKKTVPMTFDQRLSQLRRYKLLFGNASVPTNWEGDPNLGRFVSNARSAYKRYREGKTSSMNEERIQALEELGFEWERQRGCPNVPVKLVREKAAGRARASVDGEAGEEGGAVGARPTWTQRLEQLKSYREENGDLTVPSQHEGHNHLGRFVSNQRRYYRLLRDGKKTLIDHVRVAQLEELGFEWKSPRLSPTRGSSGSGGTGRGARGPGWGHLTWTERLEQLREYAEEHGNLKVPTKYQGRQNLGKFVANQRIYYKAYAEGKPSAQISKERVRQLEDLGFQWGCYQKRSAGAEVEKVPI